MVKGLKGQLVKGLKGENGSSSDAVDY